MLTIEFNSDSINQLLKDLLPEPVTLHKSFLDIDSDLEKLNALKTEFAYALKDYRLSEEVLFIEVFDALQEGEYVILNQDGDLCYEGVAFNAEPSIAKVGKKSVSELSLVELISKRKDLQTQLNEVNSLITSNLSNGLEMFDEVINQITVLKETWTERVDKMLNMAEGLDTDPEQLSAFSTMVIALKAIQDKLSSEVF